MIILIHLVQATFLLIITFSPAYSSSFEQADSVTFRYSSTPNQHDLSSTTKMVTRRSKANGTIKANAVSDLLQQAAKERVAAKKVRDEERKTDETARKEAIKTKALADEASLRNKEKTTTKENNETVISPESAQTNDSPDERINSHLLDLRTPNPTQL